MEIELGQLRSVMHQRVDVTTRWLGERSYIEAAKTRAFDRHHLAELYHENTKYRPATMPVPNRSAQAFDRPDLRFVQSVIGPDYPGVELIGLSHPRTAPTGGLQGAIHTRRSPNGFRDVGVELDRLAGLLHFAGGVTDRVPTSEAAVTKPLRAYPSAGPLYPVETYVLVRRCDGLADGVYYYPPEQAGLRGLQVDPSGFDSAIRMALVGEDHPAAKAPIIIVLTGAFWRSMAKYGPGATDTSSRNPDTSPSTSNSSPGDSASTRSRSAGSSTIASTNSSAWTVSTRPSSTSSPSVGVWVDRDGAP